MQRISIKLSVDEVKTMNSWIKKEAGYVDSFKKEVFLMLGEQKKKYTFVFKKVFNKSSWRNEIMIKFPRKLKLGSRNSKVSNVSDNLNSIFCVLQVLNEDVRFTEEYFLLKIEREVQLKALLDIITKTDKCGRTFNIIEYADFSNEKELVISLYRYIEYMTLDNSRELIEIPMKYIRNIEMDNVIKAKLDFIGIEEGVYDYEKIIKTVPYRTPVKDLNSLIALTFKCLGDIKPNECVAIGKIAHKLMSDYLSFSS